MKLPHHDYTSIHGKNVSLIAQLDNPLPRKVTFDTINFNFTEAQWEFSSAHVHNHKSSPSIVFTLYCSRGTSGDVSAQMCARIQFLRVEFSYRSKMITDEYREI